MFPTNFLRPAKALAESKPLTDDLHGCPDANELEELDCKLPRQTDAAV